MEQSDSNNILRVTQTQTQLQIEKNKMAEIPLQFRCTTNFMTPAVCEILMLQRNHDDSWEQSWFKADTTSACKPVTCF